MKKIKTGYENNFIDKNDLAYEEEVEVNGICELKGGTPIANFDFSRDIQQPVNSDNSNNSLKKETAALIDNRKGKKSANNMSPAIDNEPFKYKRCYQFRESTVRLLNEMKAKHLDINVYINRLIDEAIWYYYRNVFEVDENKRK